MSKKNKFILFLLFTALSFQWAYSQCAVRNTAFKSGEDITFDLYFKYGIVNTRAGRGSMKTSTTNYKGKSVYHINMLLNTSGLARSIYTVNDTLTSYIDMEMRPLLFTKNAFEGKDYSKEVQSYSYSGSTISIRANRIFNGVQQFDETVTTGNCAYDYLSVLPLIRNLDYSDMKPGDKKNIQFLSGKEIVNMSVNYMGKSKIKANDGKTYDTIDISLTILDKAFKNKKEAISASLTDDLNRVPIIINTHLNIGAIRAVMKQVKGLKN